MLGFYGISLDAGNALHRAVNWDERFDNLRRFVSCVFQLLVVINLTCCFTVSVHVKCQSPDVSRGKASCSVKVLC